MLQVEVLDNDIDGYNTNLFANTLSVSDSNRYPRSYSVANSCTHTYSMPSIANHVLSFFAAFVSTVINQQSLHIVVGSKYPASVRLRA